MSCTAIAPAVTAARRWIGRFPRLSRNIQVHVGTGGITLGGMADQGNATVAPPPSASLDQRVSALERQVESVQQLTIQARQNVLHHAEGLNGRITEESRARTDADKSIRDKLESLGTENLQVEAVGIFWLIAGLMLSASPGEVLALLGL